MQLSKTIKPIVLKMLFLFALANCNAKTTSQSEMEALIGNIGIGNDYQNGWKKVNSYLFFEKESMAVIAISRGNTHALTLAKVYFPEDGVKRTTKILAAVKLKKNPVGSSYHVWSSCTTPNPVNDAQGIVAEITLKRCQRYSRVIHKAWLVDASKNTISAYPANGIRCEDAGYNSGEGGPCPIVPTE